MYAFEFKDSCTKCGLEAHTQLQIWSCKNCKTVNIIDFTRPVHADLKLDDGRAINYRIRMHNSKLDIVDIDRPYWALPETLLFFAITIICMAIISYYGAMGIITAKTYYYFPYVAAALIIFLAVTLVLYFQSSRNEKKYRKIIEMYLNK